jgi:hypothetical protein
MQEGRTRIEAPGPALRAVALTIPCSPKNIAGDEDSTENEGCCTARGEDLAEDAAYMEDKCK